MSVQITCDKRERDSLEMALKVKVRRRRECRERRESWEI